jgi:hypothetical protein
MQSEILHHSQLLDPDLGIEPEELLELNGEQSTHDYLLHANSDYRELVERLCTQAANSWSTYNYDKF